MDSFQNGSPAPPNRNTRLYYLATALLWIAILLAYFLASFLTGRWGVTWMLFLIGAALQLGAVDLIFKKSASRKMIGDILFRNNITAIIAVISLIVYLPLSFGTGQWKITWLVFLAAGAVDLVVRFVRINNEHK
jgi:hypothetical protein